MHVDGKKENKEVKEVQQESTMHSGPKNSAQTFTKSQSMVG